MGTTVDKSKNLKGKLIPAMISLYGREIDRGKGFVKIESLVRLDQKDTRIDDDGIERVIEYYEKDFDDQKHVKIEDVLSDTFLGNSITGDQLFLAIAEITDNIYSGKYD